MGKRTGQKRGTNHSGVPRLPAVTSAQQRRDLLDCQAPAVAGAQRSSVQSPPGALAARPPQELMGLQAVVAADAQGVPGWDEPWDDFMARHPRVADAIAAADPKPLVHFVFDDAGPQEIVIRRTDQGPVVDWILYPWLEVRTFVSTCWLNEPDAALAEKTLSATLGALVPERLRDAGVSVVRRASGSVLPRLGWGQTVSLAGLDCWSEVRGAVVELALFDLIDLAGSYGDYGAAQSEVLEAFQANGAALVMCASCRQPITDRHPQWPGTWVTMEHEFGPACDGPQRGKTPHHPDPSLIVGGGQQAACDAESLPTVGCQQCRAPITDQHPWWNGLWVSTVGHGGPVCGVIGSSLPDGDAYDLVDCVYPHRPPGATGPGVDAARTAVAGGYMR